MQGNLDSNELLRAIKSGELSKAEINSYLSRLVLDLSRSKVELQKLIDVMKEERDAAVLERDRLKNEKLLMTQEIDGYVQRSAEMDSEVRAYEAKLREMNSLRENLTKGEAERSDLIKRISEMEGQNTRIKEELEALLSVKEQLASELENAKQTNGLLLEQQKTEMRENGAFKQDELNAELEKAVTKAREEEIVSDAGDAEAEATAEAGSAQPFYSEELMTRSGFDLLSMLRDMASGAQTDGSGVQISRSWEEESEDITGDPDSEGGQIVKKIRKKTEVSVKYINNK